MSLKFHPAAGTVLFCDFRGFEAPEMVKKRPVVVVSPKKLRRGELVTVVPLSTQAPGPERGFHHRLDPTSLRPPLDRKPTWAKCDMLYTVGFARLDLPRGAREAGRRRYETYQVTEADLKSIYGAILAGLGQAPRSA